MSVAESQTRVHRAYYAHYFDEAGALTKVGGTLYFVSEAGAVTEVELDTLNFLTVLGAMQIADAQHLDDLMQGGPVGTCLARRQEVR